MSRPTKPLIFAELGAIYLLVPIVVWQQWLPVPLIVLPLYVLAAYAVWWLAKRGGFGARQFWAGEDRAAEKALLKQLPLRLAAVTATIGLVVYVFYPEKLFALPATHPVIWLLFLVLYPLLSVYPQELLYRAFFFSRYQAIFPNKRMMIAASALCFMFMHIVFGNGIALLSTLIGGVLFRGYLFPFPFDAAGVPGTRAVRFRDVHLWPGRISCVRRDEIAADVRADDVRPTYRMIYGAGSGAIKFAVLVVPATTVTFCASLNVRVSSLAAESSTASQVTARV